MIFRRWTALLLTLCLLLTPLIVFPEESMLSEDDDPVDDRPLTAEELAELKALDAIDEDDDGSHVGPVYTEPDRSAFSVSSPAIYNCKLMAKSTIFTQRDKESKRVKYYKGTTRAEILYVGLVWCIVRVGRDIGYIMRDRIYNATAVDPVNTPNYGVQKATYLATTAKTCHVRKSMSDDDASHVVLNAGTKLSIWRIQDGWAIVIYMRKYGYINLNELKDFVAVSPTDKPLGDDTPIAAYTSFYKMTLDKTNKNRIINIRVGCERLTRVMQPGERFNFNKMVGPYRRSVGYQPAWVLLNGTSVPGYGGGTCQVSSTLYNALLQLPGIQILQRRPHGAAGASYLPHGVDAAVGNNNLNLRFINNYDFPIRIEGHTSSDGALLMVVYRADT